MERNVRKNGRIQKEIKRGQLNVRPKKEIMKTEVLAWLFCIALLVGCSIVQRPILLCPEAANCSNRDWTSLRESLFLLNGAYWLSDKQGHPVESYRYRHDYIPIIESQFVVDEQSESHPLHISSPIILKRSRKDVVLHLLQDGKETAIPMGTAVIESRGGYDILRIK